ncbi:MAG TPA: chemotaxis protein CheX [Desulfuromonadaceae bacterium]
MISSLPAIAPLDENELAGRVISDVREVFSTMVGVHDLLPLPLMTDLVTHFENSVTAMVGLAGTYSGVVCLHTPRNLALDFTSGMLGAKVTELDEEVHDAMGELANMIAGSFKHHLSRSGADIRISLPSIITGNEYFIATGAPDDNLSIGFATATECFLVSAALERG